jgi:hypothetical protein
VTGTNKEEFISTVKHANIVEKRRLLEKCYAK